MEHAGSMVIDVVSDMVCPWCFIGKRRLEAALEHLATTSDARPVVRWHPFELNPDLPSEGVDRRTYLERKFGGPERAAGIYQRVRHAGAAAGIDFHFDRIARQPNTRDAHRLVHWVQQQGDDASALVERLFSAYFVEGRSLVGHDALTAIAAESGIDADAARALLASDALRQEVAEAERRAHEIGVGGVPFFIFAGKVAVSGAQSTEVMLQAIDKARTMPAESS